MAIVYIAPSVPVPVGGIKVLYRHVEMLCADGVEAYVWHPDSPGFRCSWFDSSALAWPGRALDPQQDLVVIPEVWAATEGRQCRELGVRYAVFVQNGFYVRHLQPGVGVEDLHSAYANAALVLSISECTTQLLRAAHRCVPEDRILRMLPHFADQGSPRVKARRITFMPRKLQMQADLLVHCLGQALPPDWTLVPIEGKSEHEVQALLAESSVFLSFSDLEGLALPPMEAALAGNLVVGYTGQGCKEYFARPLFRAVEHGDIAAFLAETLRAACDVEAKVHESPDVLGQIEALRHRYGPEAQRACLRRFAQRAAELLAGAPAPRALSKAALSA